MTISRGDFKPFSVNKRSDAREDGKTFPNRQIPRERHQAEKCRKLEQVEEGTMKVNFPISASI
jgi:hypothetical protein